MKHRSVSRVNIAVTGYLDGKCVLATCLKQRFCISRVKKVDGVLRKVVVRGRLAQQKGEDREEYGGHGAEIDSAEIRCLTFANFIFGARGWRPSGEIWMDVSGQSISAAGEGTVG